MVRIRNRDILTAWLGRIVNGFITHGTSAIRRGNCWPSDVPVLQAAGQAAWANCGTGMLAFFIRCKISLHNCA